MQFWPDHVAKFGLLVLACLVAKPCNSSELYVNREEHLDSLIENFANYGLRGTINKNELPDTLKPIVVEHILEGLAFIPLAHQPVHKGFDKTGFPSLRHMLQHSPIDPITGRQTYTAIPNIDYTQPFNTIYVEIDEKMPSWGPMHTILHRNCKNVPSAILKLCGVRVSGNNYGLFCNMQIDRKQFSSISTGLDMLGYLALKIHGKKEDAYMMMSDWTAPPDIGKDFPANDYAVETELPRITWPAWVNLYFFLRHSFHSCILLNSCDKFSGSSTSNNTRCTNIFENIHQLSLTYAYFVCRYLSGNATDALCPNVCKRDPCKDIKNAIEGTCYSISLKIHKHEFFCFCKQGFLWKSPNLRVINDYGSCEPDGMSETPMIEGCTQLEFETFCDSGGTASCTIDRISPNRRPNCSCKTRYSGIDCSYRQKNACEINDFKGTVLCGEHEKSGSCNASGLRKYECRCTPASHFRWINDATMDESCIRWFPNSIWLKRAQMCGYSKTLINGHALATYCARDGCSTNDVINFLANFESNSKFVCSNHGTCQPSLMSLKSKGGHSLTDSWCQCNSQFSGQLCRDTFNAFHTWTPWTICYAKGLVKPKHRARLRFISCLELRRFDNGSAPQCISGLTETQECADVAEDLPNVLTPLDYGVASQAVISMWRIVELMLLLDAVFIVILVALLIHNRRVLDTDREKLREKAEKEAKEAAAKAEAVKAEAAKPEADKERATQEVTSQDAAAAN